MKTYRVYWLDQSRRIRRGDWIEAMDDEDARRQASTLCDEETASVEVWERARPVQEIDCRSDADGLA
jgi:hypothetical protein